MSLLMKRMKWERQMKMSNEISQEEREHIIETCKKYNKQSIKFNGGNISRAINVDYNFQNECWDKLIELIKPSLSNKNIRAVELANKLEQTYEETQDGIKTLEKVFGDDIFSTSTSWEEDIKRLAYVLRSLDATDNDDGFSWPADADGILIKPGDTVYYKCKPDEDFIVKKILFAENEFNKREWAIEILGESEDKNRGYNVSPKEVSHNKLRTLNDIKISAYTSHMNLTGPEYADVIYGLIDEAYKMGMEARDEEARKV